MQLTTLLLWKGPGFTVKHHGRASELVEQEKAAQESITTGRCSQSLSTSSQAKQDSYNAAQSKTLNLNVTFGSINKLCVGGDPRWGQAGQLGPDHR